MATQEMTERPRRTPGSRLMAAGAIVAVIGLAVAATQLLAIPRYWTTFAVGVGLLGLGALRRLMPRPDVPRDSGCGW